MSTNLASISKDIIHSDPEIMGGTPVFVGTRVPVKNLFDYIEGGHNLDEFLDDFPSVSKKQALSALKQAKQAFVKNARIA